MILSVQTNVVDTSVFFQNDLDVGVQAFQPTLQNIHYSSQRTFSFEFNGYTQFHKKSVHDSK